MNEILNNFILKKIVYIIDVKINLKLIIKFKIKLCIK